MRNEFQKCYWDGIRQRDTPESDSIEAFYSIRRRLFLSLSDQAQAQPAKLPEFSSCVVVCNRKRSDATFFVPFHLRVFLSVFSCSPVTSDNSGLSSYSVTLHLIPDWIRIVAPVLRHPALHFFFGHRFGTPLLQVFPTFLKCLGNTNNPKVLSITNSF